MIIEIRDIPYGAKVTSVEFKLTFDGINSQEQTTIITNEQIQPTIQESTPERVANIVPEMTDCEF